MLIDWFTVAAQTVNFLLLIWLLKRFLYQRILDAVDQREQHIAAQLAAAADQLASVTAQQASLTAQQQQIANERASALQATREAAELERQQLLEQAREQAEQLRDRCQAQWQQTLAQRENDVQQHVRQQVFLLGEQLMRDLADDHLDERMAAQLLRRLPELPADARTQLAQAGEIAVHSARPLSAATQDTLRNGLQAFCPQLSFHLEPGCLGGLELRIPGYKLPWNANDYLLQRIKPFEDAT